MEKRQGRPPIYSADESRQRRYDRANAQHKKTGYASQRKRDSNYTRFPFEVHNDYVPRLNALIERLGKSPMEIFFDLVEKEYGEILYDVDKPTKS